MEPTALVRAKALATASAKEEEEEEEEEEESAAEVEKVEAALIAVVAAIVAAAVVVGHGRRGTASSVWPTQQIVSEMAHRTGKRNGRSKPSGRTNAGNDERCCICVRHGKVGV